MGGLGPLGPVQQGVGLGGRCLGGLDAENVKRDHEAE